MSWLNGSNYCNNTRINTENVVVVEALRKMQRLGTKLGFGTIVCNCNFVICIVLCIRHGVQTSVLPTHD